MVKEILKSKKINASSTKNIMKVKIMSPIEYYLDV